MELILLLGLVGLWILNQRLAGRVEGLERELADLRGELPEAEARPAQAPLREPPRQTAPAAPAAPAARGWIGGEETVQSGPPEERDAPPKLAEERETLAALFERLVGGRLLIWIGGIALAVAGLFLVRHSIEIGLITPPVRMAMAALFGLLLVAAGEVARRRPDGLVDRRVAQALVGAGMLVLYAAAYGSHVLYGLIGIETASAAMVAVTAAALFLSLRHGAPAALLGLVGGFATPALVGDSSSGAIPLLTYVGLLDIAIFAIAARRGWTWLAGCAVVLSFVWTGFLAFGPPDHALAAGFFILAFSVAASAVRVGSGWQLVFLRPAGIGAVQLAILVSRDDLGPAAWLLFALISAATFLLAPRAPEYRPLPALAFLLALPLLALKAVLPGSPLVPEAAIGITLLFAAGAAPGLLRGRILDALVACAALTAPALILRLARPALLAEAGWGAVFAGLALAAALLAWRRSPAARDAGAPDAALVLAAAAALFLAGLAALELLPGELVGPAWFALALLPAFAARRLDAAGLPALALVAATAAACWTIAMVPRLWGTLALSLAGEPALATALPPLPRALLVLALPVPLLVLLWRVVPRRRASAAPLALAGLLAAATLYLLFKQIFFLEGREDFIAWGLAERTLLNQLLFAGGWLLCSGRVPVPGLDAAQRRIAGLTMTGLAAARLLWFDMLLHNPVLAEQWVGAAPVANLILPAFLLSALWLYLARRGADSEARSGLWLALFLGALIGGTMLLVRQAFHGPILADPAVYSSESYLYSLAGLLLSIALLLGGIRLPDKALRVAGLALLTATILKVFLSDASALEGVLRILSFLGLGIALIGIGKLYTKVLAAEARPRAA